jgi:hypothetical protein
MQVNENDLEQLELYLDHELADGDVRRLDERLAAEAPLAGALEGLRGQRSLRLSAMSTAFGGDAASVERLVASVRVAQASEAMRRRRFFASGPQARSALGAAACVAFGLLLGVTLQNRHGSAGGVIASPAVTSQSSFLNSDVNLAPHGAYAVSLMDANGREVMKVRFPTREQAQQCIDRINNRVAGAPTIHVGDARMLDEPY